MLIAESFDKVSRFTPVFYAPVFKVPLGHVIVAFVVDVVEKIILDYKICGIVVDIQAGGIEFCAHFFDLIKVAFFEGI